MLGLAHKEGLAGSCDLPVIAEILRRVGNVGEGPIIEHDPEVAVIRVRESSMQSPYAIDTIDFLLSEELENIGVVYAACIPSEG